MDYPNTPHPSTRTHGKRLWLGLRLLYWLLVLLVGALIGVSLAQTSRRTASGGNVLDRQAAATCVTFDHWLKTGGLDKSSHDALLTAANHSAVTLQPRGHLVTDECTTILTIPRG
jgi:hypothetical protein